MLAQRLRVRVGGGAEAAEAATPRRVRGGVQRERAARAEGARARAARVRARRAVRAQVRRQLVRPELPPAHRTDVRLATWWSMRPVP